MKNNTLQKICNLLYIYLPEKNICNLIINQTKKPLTFNRKISKYLYQYIKDFEIRQIIINKIQIQTDINLPLNYFFYRNDGLACSALPSVSLLYTKIKINLNLPPFDINKYYT
jgi:hypothetical protein